MFLISSCSCLCPIHLSHVLSGAAPTVAAPTTSELSTMIVPIEVRLIWEVWRYFSSTHSWLVMRRFLRKPPSGNRTIQPRLLGQKAFAKWDRNKPACKWRVSRPWKRHRVKFGLQDRIYNKTWVEETSVHMKYREKVILFESLRVYMVHIRFITKQHIAYWENRCRWTHKRTLHKSTSRAS